MIEIKKDLLNPLLKKQIQEGLSRHSLTTTGFDEKSEAIAFIAYDQTQFVGAITLEVFWGALHIKNLYVEEHYRDHGIATQLMEKALIYGQEFHCPFAFVETMSFQALGFYQKQGFELEFTRSGYAHETAFHYLKKNL